MDDNFGVVISPLTKTQSAAENKFMLCMQPQEVHSYGIPLPQALVKNIPAQHSIALDQKKDSQSSSRLATPLVLVFVLSNAKWSSVIMLQVIPPIHEQLSKF